MILIAPFCEMISDCNELVYCRCYPRLQHNGRECGVTYDQHKSLLFMTAVFLAILYFTCVICGFQLILSPIVTPRDSFSCTCSIATASISICTYVFNLHLPKKSRNLVLLTFKDNLFQSNHHFNF